jgi:hypothetical protein
MTDILRWTKEKDISDKTFTHFLGHPKDCAWAAVFGYRAFGAKMQYRVEAHYGIAEATTTCRNLKIAKSWAGMAVKVLEELETK